MRADWRVRDAVPLDGSLPRRQPEEVLEMDVRPSPVTDPAVIEAIEAEFMLSVARARALAIRRLSGVVPPPAPRPRLLLWMRTVRERQGDRGRG